MNSTPPSPGEATSHWGPDVVAAVSRHMNADHAEDNALIVRRLGGVADAVSAVMTGMDPDGIAFSVRSRTGAERVVLVPWLSVPVDRADVRAQVVALHTAAVDALP